MSITTDLERISRHAASYLGDIKLKHIELLGEKLFYLDGGKGETIVLLHGMGVSKSSWRSVMHQLCENYRLIAIDIPGYNYEKLALNSNYSFRSLSDWLDLLLSHFDLGKYHLVGHSLGSALSAYYASRSPQNLSSLTLINFPIFACDPSQSQADLLNIFNTLWAETPEQFHRTLKTLFHSPPYIPDMAIKRYIKQISGNRYLFDKLVVDTSNSIPQLYSRMSNIEVPILTLTGINDLYSPPTTPSTLARICPQIIARTLEGSGHFSLLENPTDISKHMGQFYQSLKTKH